MNGPEHYREAERLTAKAFDGDTMFTPDVRARLLRGAQVHATLALAAAQALPTVTQSMGDSDLVTDWGHTIGWVIPAEIVDDDEDLIDELRKIADVPEAACGAVWDETGIRCIKRPGHTDHHKGASTDEHGAPVLSRWSNTKTTPTSTLTGQPCTGHAAPRTEPKWNVGGPIIPQPEAAVYVHQETNHG